MDKRRRETDMNLALHCAFAFGGPAVADMMLSAGGDMTKQNAHGQTPADCVLVEVCKLFVAISFLLVTIF